MFTHERLLHGEEDDLKYSVLSAFLGLFKIYMYIYCNDLFDLSNKQGGRGLKGENRSSGEERITDVCVLRESVC